MTQTKPFARQHAGGGVEIAALAGTFFAIKPMITLVAVKVLGQSAQAGSALRLILTMVLFGLCAITALSGTSSRRQWIAPVAWAWGFVALAGLSFAWSQANSPLVSAAYWLGTVLELSIVLIVIRFGAEERTAESMMQGFIVGALIVVFTAWVMPVQDDLRLGDEDYFNSNNIAFVCSFAAFFAQFLILSGRRRWKWALVVLALTILRTLSKATIAAFLVSQAWLLLRDQSMQRKTKVKLICGAVVALALFTPLFAAYFDIYTTNGNQAETLTGRTAIWAWALQEGLERPWLGHGFDAMWKIAPVFGTFEARHAENELLQQFYAFGLAGLIVTFGCYVSVWRAIRKAGRDPRWTAMAALVLFVVVRGLAEAEPFDLLLPLWFIALVARLANAWKAEPMRDGLRNTLPRGPFVPNVIPL